MHYSKHTVECSVCVSAWPTVCQSAGISEEKTLNTCTLARGSCWLFSCRQLDSKETYLANISTGCSSPPQGESEEDWSIWSKRRQDKFLCYQVVYKRTLSNFPWPHEQLRIYLEDLYIYIFNIAMGVAPRSWSKTSRSDYTRFVLN